MIPTEQSYAVSRHGLCISLPFPSSLLVPCSSTSLEICLPHFKSLFQRLNPISRPLKAEPTLRQINQGGSAQHTLRGTSNWARAHLGRFSETGLPGLPFNGIRIQWDAQIEQIGAFEAQTSRPRGKAGHNGGGAHKLLPIEGDPRVHPFGNGTGGPSRPNRLMRSFMNALISVREAPRFLFMKSIQRSFHLYSLWSKRCSSAVILTV